MKRCTKCNIEKSLEEYYKHGLRYRNDCKSCFNKLNYQKRKSKNSKYNNAYYNKLWHSKKDNHYSVYALPNANYYIGYTKSIRNRFIAHRNMKIDTSDYIILHKCKTEQKALWYEAVYHEIGFPGKHIKAKKV